NANDWAPHINAVTVARFIAEEPTTSGAGPAVTAVAAARCVAGDAVVAVSIGNGGDSHVSATVSSEFATAKVDEVPAGETGPIGNANDWAPHINAVTVARFIAEEPTTSGAGPAVTAVAAARCVAGDAVVAVSIGNGGDSHVSATVSSEFATAKVDEVPAGETVTRVLPSHMAQIPAGEVEVHVTDAAGIEQETTAPYPALSCS